MKNWPILVSAIAAALVPVAIKFGFLTVESAGAIGVIVGPIWTGFVHRLQSPNAVAK